MPDIVLYHGNGNRRSAIYVDGTLDSYGDHENVIERAIELTGVTINDSDDWLRGENLPVRVATNLDQIRDYRQSLNAEQRRLEREARRMALTQEAQYHTERAERLRSEAAALAS